MVALVHERQYADRVANVLPDTPNVTTVPVVEDGSDEDFQRYGGVEFYEALAEGSPERDFGIRSADDIYLLYTGGTTGFPKGVMWRHEDIYRVLLGGTDFATGQFVADEYDHAKQAAAGPPMIRFPIPLMIHGATQSATWMALFAGQTVVLAPEFDAEQVWQAVERHKVNLLFFTGDAMGRPLLDALEGTVDDRDLSSLFLLASTAALFSLSLASDSRPAAQPGDHRLHRLGNRLRRHSAWWPRARPRPAVPGHHRQEHRGARRRRQRSPSRVRSSRHPGQTGQHPGRLTSDEKKTAETFRTINGVRYAIPGDYAMVEEDGTVTMLGRGSVSINTGGEKVYPEEVEGGAQGHPDVFDALVVGVPDERYGQHVAAVVAPRTGTRPRCRLWMPSCANHIAGYKVPRSLWIVDEVKRSPVGKPDYKWAKEQTEERPPTRCTASTPGAS